MKVVDELFNIQVVRLIDFTKSLIPGLPDEVIGCRMPEIKVIAKKMIANNKHEEFLKSLPHKYHEENLLHAFILEKIKVSQTELFNYINEFLPYVNNWSVCDSLASRSKVLTSDLKKLFEQVKIWLEEEQTYHVRFALITMMKFYLKDEFIDEVLCLATNIKTDEYYINMALSWLYATALINYYDKIVKLLEEHKLDIFVHNKTIQKAIESYRISIDKKEYLKTLKRKTKGIK